MAGRVWGDHCDACGHARELHNLDGALGACCRVGCECGGYLEEKHSHAEVTAPGEEVIVTIQKRHRGHGGWKDRA